MDVLSLLRRKESDFYVQLNEGNILTLSSRKIL